jgi:hypothetical protein
MFILVNSVTKDVSMLTKVDIFLELLFNMGITSYSNKKNFMHLLGYIILIFLILILKKKN